VVSYPTLRLCSRTIERSTRSLIWFIERAIVDVFGYITSCVTQQPHAPYSISRRIYPSGRVKTAVSFTPFGVGFVGFRPLKVGSVMWDLPRANWVHLCGIRPPKLESVMWDRASQNWGQVCGTQHSTGSIARLTTRRLRHLGSVIHTGTPAPPP
jgi:hypothetical protein